MKFNLLTIAFVLVAALLFSFGQTLFAIGLLGIGISILALGIFNIRLQFFIPQIKHDNGILLTFDDGPIPGKTERILDVLSQANIKAIFFLIGDRVSSHPRIAQRILAEGHAIGNHTYSHDTSFTVSTTKACLDEIQKCNDAIHAATGVRPRLFRPPFGISNPQIGRAVQASGLDALGWTVRSLDTVKHQIRTMRRLKGKTRAGSVVLLHDHGSLSPDLLKEYIEHCRSQGYSFSDVDNYKRRQNG